jgi:hypothetical protein
MAPKYHPTPLSGGDRKALSRELARSQAMTTILAEQAAQCRAEGEALVRKADDLACQSWNEKMWSVGGPIDPSPTIGEALNGGYPWLEVQCSRCKSKRSIDLAAIERPQCTFIYQLADALQCRKCKRFRSARAVLHQLTKTQSHFPDD